MDLELTDEQTLAQRVADDAPGARMAAPERRTPRRRNSAPAVGRADGFGLLDDGLGAVELCLAARRSARTWPPRRSSAARRCASRPAVRAAKNVVAIACSSRVAIWASPARHAAVEHGRNRGRSAAWSIVESSRGVARSALAAAPGRRRSSRRPRSTSASRCSASTFDSIEARADRRPTSRRLTAIGGAARRRGVGRRGRAHARRRARYAAERRQFGRTIGSYQALRHILADMYVRRASAWSTVLYAAAALDDDARGPADRSDREGVRGPRRARGRARRDAGLRRHRLHRGAPGAPLPAAHRRARAAVRGRRLPRARARPRARAPPRSERA